MEVRVFHSDELYCKRRTKRWSSSQKLCYKLEQCFLPFIVRSSQEQTSKNNKELCYEISYCSIIFSYLFKPHLHKFVTYNSHLTRNSSAKRSSISLPSPSLIAKSQKGDKIHRTQTNLRVIVLIGAQEALGHHKIVKETWRWEVFYDFLFSSVVLSIYDVSGGNFLFFIF